MQELTELSVATFTLCDLIYGVTREKPESGHPDFFRGTIRVLSHVHGIGTTERISY